MSPSLLIRAGVDKNHCLVVLFPKDSKSQMLVGFFFLSGEKVLLDIVKKLFSIIQKSSLQMF